MKKLISEIHSEGKRLQTYTDDELRLESKKIHQLFKISSKSLGISTIVNSIDLSSILVPWYAIVKEVSIRTLGLSHYDTQLLAGILLHQGKIVEMKTGEGKTLASTLPISLNALSGKGVHVVTVNEYLAERDKLWMSKLYEKLGLTVGLIKNTSSLTKKKQNYSNDITYVTNSELVFDYLRDCSALISEEMIQRPFSYCIVDEIDSILIDEARTPLILSVPQGKKDIKKLFIAKKIARSLERDRDFEIDEKRRDVYLTEISYKKIAEQLGKTTLYDTFDPWILEILNALKAEYLFKKQKDYIVVQNKVLIIDEFTGRIMEDRRWSQGIHEAIEVKEIVPVGEATETKSSITYQNFFTLYPKLAGMTGTAKTAEKEFQEIYKLPVVVLDTYKPLLRKDLSDYIYPSQFVKWKAVLEVAKTCFKSGQPLLIGTVSVEKSDFLSELFRLENLPHEVLNAKAENVSRESQIIAEAGKRYAITIATNMAGRGTDIVLGGNPQFEVKRILFELVSTFFTVYESFVLKTYEEFQQKDQGKKSEEFNVENVEAAFFSSFTFSNISAPSLTPKKRSSVSFLSLFPLFQSSEDRKKLFSFLNDLRLAYFQQPIKLKKDIANFPYSLDTAKVSFRKLCLFLEPFVRDFWLTESEEVKKLGGLYVLGTERHETRRIDNQLRGRSGRQGDPGISQFYVSLDDNLLQVFGGSNLKQSVISILGDENTPLEGSLLTKSLENAQEKVESYNYDIRKNVFDYDILLNQQRKDFFQARRELFDTSFFLFSSLQASESTFDQLFFTNKKFFSVFSKEKKNSMLTFLSETPCSSETPFSLPNRSSEKLFIHFSDFLFGSYAFYLFSAFLNRSNSMNLKNQTKPKMEKTTFCFFHYNEIWIYNELEKRKIDFYQFGLKKQKMTSNFLTLFDILWVEHIKNINATRETINWRSYGQQNPLVEYNKQTKDSFARMFEKLRISML